MKRVVPGTIFKYNINDDLFIYGVCMESYQIVLQTIDKGGSTAPDLMQVGIAFPITMSYGTLHTVDLIKVGMAKNIPDQWKLIPKFYSFDNYKKAFSIVTPGIPYDIPASRSEVNGLYCSCTSHIESLKKRASSHFFGTLTVWDLAYGKMLPNFNTGLYYSDYPPGPGIQVNNPQRYLIEPDRLAQDPQ